MSDRRDIVVIGCSAGGVVALRYLFGRLPSPLPGTILAVIHRSPYHLNHLAAVLRGGGGNAVHEPARMEHMERGRIYLAPRDQHLLVEDGILRPSRGPKEHSTRPAIDPLFRSAAAAFGPRVVGIVLTGGGYDGSSGLIAIKAAGGLSIVQDPTEALAASMPTRAIVNDHVDAVLSLDEIAEAIPALMEGRPFGVRAAASSAIAGAEQHRG